MKVLFKMKLRRFAISVNLSKIIPKSNTKDKRGFWIIILSKIHINTQVNTNKKEEKRYLKKKNRDLYSYLLFKNIFKYF